MSADKLVDYYSSIMQDDESLSDDQKVIADSVQDSYNCISNDTLIHVTSPNVVRKNIKKLKCNSSPGSDGVTSEYFIHGNSNVLCNVLSSVYSMMLTHNCVPWCFKTGVIIPILKKPTLDPNRPESYRPITLSNTLSKLFEATVELKGDISFSQYGFRSGCGTSFGIALLNDIMCYGNQKCVMAPWPLL